MPSPQRLFRNFTTAQLDALIASAADRAVNGTFTSLGGGSKSSSIENMSIEDILREVNYEKGIRAGTLGPSKTYQDFTGNRPPNTVNE